MSKKPSALDVLADTFNIGKRIKYYFNKWLFRIAFIIVGFLWVVSISIDGIGNHFLYQCPTSAVQCTNEYYLCDDLGMSECPPNYPEELRTQQYFKGGYQYGKEPSFLSKYLIFIMTFLILLTFIVNHFLYNQGGNQRANRPDQHF